VGSGVRSGDLERFLGLQSRSWCRFCWHYIYFSEIFVGSLPYKTPEPNFCGGPDPRTHTGSAPMIAYRIVSYISKQFIPCSIQEAQLSPRYHVMLRV